MKPSTKTALLKRGASVFEMLGICALLLSLFKSWLALIVGIAGLLIAFALTYFAEEQ